VAPSIKSRGF